MDRLFDALTKALFLKKPDMVNSSNYVAIQDGWWSGELSASAQIDRRGTSNQFDITDKGFPVNGTFEINYISKDNSLSRRVICEVEYIPPVFLKAYCQLRQERRTFRIDKIQRCVVIETGEVIEDVFSYFQRLPKKITTKKRRTIRTSESIAVPEKYIVFDLETTGLDPVVHEIIEIGAIKVNTRTDYHTTFSILIKPTQKVSKKITSITGITQEMLDNGDSIESAIADFVEFIEDLQLVAYNAEFDLGFLYKALEKNGITINNPVFCALKLVRIAYPEMSSYKLSNVAESLGISADGSHRALKDSELAMKVFVNSINKLRNN